MSSLLGQAAGTASSALLGIFGYNRENFRYDRRQRQMMEYQLAEMRIKQVNLWRKDVRSVMELTPRKMEVYLLVIALELNATACALCKARVPPGSPPWLAACHTLAACSALMYLIMALWFGLHAFVAAQAYKVRILTQIVRPPIPTWQALEASRTYSSAFEQLRREHLFRVPFFHTGSQATAGDAPAAAAAAADPWGLERCGDDLPELQPGVNGRDVAKQQHVWHVREAARYYQTYDAFCRICMSAGTSSLANFFAFFCLSYVLTENAAPVPAWAGMLLFSGISILLLGNDIKVTRTQFVVASALQFCGPIMCSAVSFVSSRNRGDPGDWEWLMPVALFTKGAWFQYYLYIFKVKEMQTGAFLPYAFKGVLYIDPFGWAKHTLRPIRRMVSQAGSGVPRLWRGGGASGATGAAAGAVAGAAGAHPAPAAAFPAAATEGRRHGLPPQQSGLLHSQSQRNLDRAPSSFSNSSLGQAASLPSMQCLQGGFPMRPEDTEPHRAGPLVGAAWEPLVELGPRDLAEDTPYVPHVSFRPGSFASVSTLDPSQTGADIHGEIPGLVPWRYFALNTGVVTALWWAASMVSAWNAYDSAALFVQPTYGLGFREVAPIPLLIGQEVRVGWHGAATLPRAHGLSCDARGAEFVTVGRDADGARRLFHGRLSPAAAMESARRRFWPLPGRTRAVAGSVQFEPAPPCHALGNDRAAIQDVALAGTCGHRASNATGTAGCFVMVLPQRGVQLVPCPPEAGSAGDSTARPRPMARQWLEDRGGSAGDVAAEGILQPEDLAAVTPAPCSRHGAGPESAEDFTCAVVATTARRLVLLGAAGATAATGVEESLRPLVPRQLLQAGGDGTSESLRSGSLTLFDGRFLGVLHRSTSSLRVLDLLHGGRHVGTWRLHGRGGDAHGRGTAPRRWASICSGGGAFFAMEDAEQPGLWRFPAPRALLART